MDSVICSQGDFKDEIVWFCDSSPESVQREQSAQSKLTKACFYIQYGTAVAIKINIEHDHSSKFFLLKTILVFK